MNTPVAAMKSNALTRCALITALAVTILSSRAATLSEGDPAPKLTVSKWIQGEPVKAYQPGTAYLVEFWATWWLPSLEPMAHINRIHEKFKDKGLVVIGQDVKEKEPKDVERFAKGMHGLISYPIALDEGATTRFSGTMLSNYLYAAEAGIPTAFVIDKKGTISFIGHPDDLSDELIEQVLAGTLDPKKRALDREANVAKAETWEMHNDLGKAAFKAKEWDKATREVGELEKIYPQRRVMTECLRMTILMGQDKFDAAAKLAVQLGDENKDDPFVQQRVARTLSNRGTTNSVILEKANVLMDRANALTKRSVPAFLHTQAKIAFLQGKKEKAIELETEAVGLADSLTKDDFAQALDLYRKGKLPQ
jgi:hypothetical protein